MMSQVVQERRDRQVFVVPSERVADFYLQPAFYSDVVSVSRIDEAISAAGQFVDRGWAEANDSVKQVVACSLIHKGPRLLCLRRSRKSNREGLRLRHTLLIGGHVDDSEIRSSSPVLDCLLRELREELDIRPARTPKFLGFVTDPTTRVGLLHIGLVHLVEVVLDTITVNAKCDNQEFTKAGRKVVYPLAGVRELQALCGNFDMWSSLFLASDVACDLLGTEKPLLSVANLPLKWASHSRTP